MILLFKCRNFILVFHQLVALRCWDKLQVDLKLKISRGSSIRKILVREAKLYSAAKVIVGTTRSHGPIGSPASVAKYCAKKLSKDCWVLAVNNGKIIYQREGSPAKICISQGCFKFSCFPACNVNKRLAMQESTIIFAFPWVEFVF